MARLGPSGLAQLFREIANYVSTRLSDYKTKAELDSLLDTKADDNNVIHTSGDETIEGVKTFSDKIISNKELHYIDTQYNWTDTSLNTWCDAGHVAWFDKTGNRRMHELVGAQNGVWRKACYINENQYFSVDSNRNITYWGTATFNGYTIFNQDMIFKNNNMDITTKPSSTIYSNYIFKDKNEKILSYIQYAHNPNGIHNLGLFITDSADKLYGVVVNSAKEFYPYGDNTYSLGKSNMRWANAYITNTYTNRVTTYSITHPSGDNNSYFFVSGGSDYDKGATLYLGGVSATNFTPGRFALAARKTDGSSIELAGSPDGSLTWGGKNIALDENLVHTSGNEYINGTKMFSNTIHRYADLTTSGYAQVYRFDDTNANACGHIYNSTHWSGDAIFNRHGAYNNKSGKTMEIDIISTDSGVGVAYVTGTANKGNVETATSATGDTAIATMGWVNNPATSTNVVHRSGDETIAGFKSFTEVLDRRNDVTISTVATATQLVDTNANRCGWIANRMHWAGNYHVHNRHIAYNENSGKEVYIDIISSNDGSGGLFISGTAINRNLFDATSETGHTAIATMGWVNNPATSTNVVHRTGDETITGNKTFSNKIKGNLQGNADSSTKASYLDNYSLPGGNKIYLDWDTQRKGYVGLKVDKTTMGGLITTDNIGSQGYVTLTSLAGGNRAGSLSHSVGSLILASCSGTAFASTKSYANVAGLYLYPCRTEIYTMYNATGYHFEPIVVRYSTEMNLGSGTWRYLGGSGANINNSAGEVFGMFLRVA